MFFITNDENSIIAADSEFLEKIGADDIFSVAAMTGSGALAIDEEQQTVHSSETSIGFTKIPLNTFFGKSYLYQCSAEAEELSPSEEEKEEAGRLEPELEDTLTLLGVPAEEEKEPEKTPKDDDEEILKLLNQEEAKDEKESEAGLSLSDEPLALGDIPGITPKEEEEEELRAEKPANIPLEEPLEITPLALHDEAPEETVSEESNLGADVTIAKQNIAIIPQEISQKIGISEEEYNNFLQVFSQESLRLEESLRSHNLKENREAISLLKDAALLLQLPHLCDQLNALENAASDEKETLVNAYFADVTALTLSGESEETPLTIQEEAPIETATQPQEEELPTLDLMPEEEEPLMVREEEPAETVEPVGIAPEKEEIHGKAEETKTELSGAISLDGVAPIPFEFSLKEASEELSLPESLVEEFVTDFIAQAHENIPVLQKAYSSHDMTQIQRVAHMLKGASSNLRIVPMADTLYELQFNTEYERIPEIFRIFYGQLLALEKQLENYHAQH